MTVHVRSETGVQLLEQLVPMIVGYSTPKTALTNSISWKFEHGSPKVAKTMKSSAFVTEKEGITRNSIPLEQSLDARKIKT